MPFKILRTRHISVFESFKKASVCSILLAILILSESTLAEIRQEDTNRISPGIRFLAKMENQFNPVDNEVRTDRPFEIEHFEIPLRLAKNLFSSDSPQIIKDALIFTKNGEAWIRWIPNPDDNLYKDKLVQFLAEQGIDPTLKRRFIGFRTASRSVLIFDPITGAEFSVKASTNNTRGYWKDKPETSTVAGVVAEVSKYVTQTIPRMDPQYVDTIKIAPEPGGFAINSQGIDQGMLVRTYPFSKGKLLIPIFSLFHEEFGRQFAKANGYAEPLQFVREKLFPLWIKSIVQFSFSTGIMSNSAHGQNYLVEVTKNLKMTGKIVHRDFADARINSAMIARNEGTEKIIKAYQDFSKTNYSNEVLTGSREDGFIAFKIHFSPVQSNLINTWYPEALTAKGGIDVYYDIERIVKNEIQNILKDRVDGRNFELELESEFAYKKHDGRYESQIPFRVRLWHGRAIGEDNRTPFTEYLSPRKLKCSKIFE